MHTHANHHLSVIDDDMGCWSAKGRSKDDLTGRGLEATGADATMLLAKEAIGTLDRHLSYIMSATVRGVDDCARWEMHKAMPK